MRPESQSPQRQTPGKTVSAPTWWQKRPISGEKNHDARQRGPSTNRRGGPQDLGPATCPQHFPIHTSPGALGAIWSTRGACWQSGGGAGGAGKRGRGSERAGVALPGSPARAGTGPSESPGEDLVRDKEISHSAASDERAPRGTAPGPRPPYPGHPVRLGPVPSPRPELAVEEGAGQGEKKSRPPTGTHVGTLKGRVRPPRPPARAGPGPSTSPDPGGLENIFPGRRLPGDQSPRGTAPVLARAGLSGSPLAAQAGPVPTSGVRLGKTSVRMNPTTGTHARPPPSPSRPPPA